MMAPPGGGKPEVCVSRSLAREVTLEIPGQIHKTGEAAKSAPRARAIQTHPPSPLPARFLRPFPTSIMAGEKTWQGPCSVAARCDSAAFFRGPPPPFWRQISHAPSLSHQLFQGGQPERRLSRDGATRPLPALHQPNPTQPNPVLGFKFPASHGRGCFTKLLWLYDWTDWQRAFLFLEIRLGGRTGGREKTRMGATGQRFQGRGVCGWMDGEKYRYRGSPVSFHACGPLRSRGHPPASAYQTTPPLPSPHLYPRTAAGPPSADREDPLTTL
ncbi:uncharacterized protein B0T15DRAFT_228948 [Chaetomium strumarium]|uniref:Uncharacterized protein n=1 Tax=Chaetomium strumarium TaxID=1170767 RepID=A0AAJ0M043_9PEZI|nr:hypothetical protein B0T15DRAFT_228948 [Chaetomium strumarium]